MQATPQSKQEPNDLTFDVRGIDPAIANALRRILIAEVRGWLHRVGRAWAEHKPVVVGPGLKSADATHHSRELAPARVLSDLTPKRLAGLNILELLRNVRNGCRCLPWR